MKMRANAGQEVGASWDAGVDALLQPLDASNLEQVLFEVGTLVDSLYPLGLQKLTARCSDAIDGRAAGHVLLVRDEVVGFAMESPKPEAVIKLSTIWIHPEYRRSGLGRALSSHLVSAWIRRGVPSAHVTARVGLHLELESALGPLGFRTVAIVDDRYGPGRHEAVLRWLPERSPSVDWLDFHRSRLTVG